MANRITGKDCYISMTGAGTTNNRAFVGEVDSFTADYTAEHTDTRPVHSKTPFHQMTGSTYHVSMQGGATDALYLWLASAQDAAYQAGGDLPRWSLTVTATNTATGKQTIDATFNNGMVYTANLQLGRANELVTQQIELYFDDAKIVVP